MQVQSLREPLQDAGSTNDLNLQDVISGVSKTAGLTTVADAACFSILLQSGPADGFPSLSAASGSEEAPEPHSQRGMDTLSQHPLWMEKTPGYKGSLNKPCA